MLKINYKEDTGGPRACSLGDWLNACLISTGINPISWKKAKTICQRPQRRSKEMMLVPGKRKKTHSPLLPRASHRHGVAPRHGRESWMTLQGRCRSRATVTAWNRSRLNRTNDAPRPVMNWPEVFLLPAGSKGMGPFLYSLIFFF